MPQKQFVGQNLKLARLKMFRYVSGVEEDAEFEWGHLKFLALNPPPKNLHQNLQLN